jgi:hypothetical protein
MPNPVLLYAATGLGLAGLVGTLLGFYGIVSSFLFISPILYAAAVTVFAIGVGLRQPIAILIIFAIVSVLLLGISLDHWFGLPGFI